MNYLQVLALVFMVTISCKEKSTETKESTTTPEVEVAKTETKQTKQEEEYVSQSVDDQLAKNIKNFLINDHLKNDISAMNDTDRKFQMYKIDLNKDGKDEVFVRFLTPYFCGTGGCSFLLLDHQGEIITNFSVTRAPIFAEQTYKNDWQILLVKDAGVFKELIYKNGTYPANPSLLEKAPYDAPSGHAEIMFDKDFSNCKTYNF